MTDFLPYDPLDHLKTEFDAEDLALVQRALKLYEEASLLLNDGKHVDDPTTERNRARTLSVSIHDIVWNNRLVGNRAIRVKLVTNHYNN